MMFEVPALNDCVNRSLCVVVDAKRIDRDKNKYMLIK